MTKPACYKVSIAMLWALSRLVYVRRCVRANESSIMPNKLSKLNNEKRLDEECAALPSFLLLYESFYLYYDEIFEIFSRSLSKLSSLTLPFLYIN